MDFISNKFYRSEEFIAALESGQLGKAKKILEINKDVIDCRNKYDYTALMLAAFKGYKDIVEMLMKSGADVNI